MIEILQFIFSGFWIFIGSLLLIGAVLNGLANVILAIRGKRQQEADDA